MCGEGQLNGGGEKLSSYDVELPTSSGRRSFEDCNECGIVLITETAPGRLPRDVGHDDHLVRDVSALRLQCSCTCTEATLERGHLLLCGVVESLLRTYPAGSTLQLGPRRMSSGTSGKRLGPAPSTTTPEKLRLQERSGSACSALLPRAQE
jgi:hypothetical protein